MGGKGMGRKPMRGKGINPLSNAEAFTASETFLVGF
jgi:hypothetical protein